LVTIITRLRVVQPDGVAQLVSDDSHLEIAASDRNLLLVADHSDPGVAAVAVDELHTAWKSTNLFVPVAPSANRTHVLSFQNFIPS
ncbi:hypothetical protein PMAYCL1PPCAC_31378, partial [Pristionchus mayeri]